MPESGPSAGLSAVVTLREYHLGMTDEEAIAALDAIVERQQASEHPNADAEIGHGEADAILLAVVSPEVRAAYERVVEAMPWWACA